MKLTMEKKALVEAPDFLFSFVPAQPLRIEVGEVDEKEDISSPSSFCAKERPNGN